MNNCRSQANFIQQSLARSRYQLREVCRVEARLKYPAHQSACWENAQQKGVNVFIDRPLRPENFALQNRATLRNAMRMRNGESGGVGNALQRSENRAKTLS
jgi:hypothetical protein